MFDNNGPPYRSTWFFVEYQYSFSANNGPKQSLGEQTKYSMYSLIL